MTTSKRARVRVDAAANRAEATRLRRAGLTMDQIAAALGVGKTTVSRYLDDSLLELHRIAVDNMDAWRSAQLAELQDIRDRAWRQIDGGGDGGGDTSNGSIAPLLGQIIRAQEREAKLLGLDAPLEVVGSIDPELTTEHARAVLARFGVTRPG